ncbi:MAG: ACT domain-containing protein [Fodinibius sp.]|nr:ACT domain-containing protein [Fodinibius sp.]
MANELWMYRGLKILIPKFLGAVKVIGEDRVGMINDITDVLSKSLETNMKSINVNSDSGMFEGILTVYVDDIESPRGSIIDKLQKVEGVKSVLSVTNKYVVFT